MSYRPPNHIILRRHTDAISDKDLAFLQLALQRQARDLAKHYEIRPIGVTLVTPDAAIPQADALGIDFVDDDGLPGVAHHGHLPGANFSWALVGVKEDRRWTLSASHEFLEMAINPQLDRWAMGPEEWRWPMEVCDPVEDHGYPVGATLFGEERDVLLSNFVLPSFWRMGSTGPWDFLGVLDGPFDIAPGGYALVERNGYLVNVGTSSRRGRQRSASRIQRLRDRTWPGRR